MTSIHLVVCVRCLYLKEQDKGIEPSSPAWKAGILYDH